MMAVITDDFTGAAEIGGIALSMGYDTVIKTENVSETEADILIVATDMRSLSPEQAAEKSRVLTRKLLSLDPDMIFKKVDSVLRGNIGPELEAQMNIENKSRALLIPANPSLDRIIVDGVYYVKDIPVAETGFEDSQSGPSASSHVVDILKRRGMSGAISISIDDEMWDQGIYVGNTKMSYDLHAWAEKINDHVVPAGAAGFFSAILKNLPPSHSMDFDVKPIQKSSKALYICGSKFPASKAAVLKAKAKDVCVISMPDDIYFDKKYSAELFDRWVMDVSTAFAKYTSVLVTVLQTRNGTSLSGLEITQTMANLTRKVMKNIPLDELMIEGGATAQAVMKALEINTLYPVQSLSPGVTRMRVDNYKGLHVTMKPGSYSWPRSIWRFNK